MEFALGTIPVLAIAGFMVLRSNMEYADAFELRGALWGIIAIVIFIDLALGAAAIGLHVDPTY